MISKRAGAIAGTIGLVLALAGSLVASAERAQRAAPTCRGQEATIIGKRGNDGANDPVEGTRRADVIVARGGDDVVDGKDGGDLICAGPAATSSTAGAARTRSTATPAATSSWAARTPTSSSARRATTS